MSERVNSQPCWIQICSMYIVFASRIQICWMPLHTDYKIVEFLFILDTNYCGMLLYFGYKFSVCLCVLDTKLPITRTYAFRKKICRMSLRPEYKINEYLCVLDTNLFNAFVLQIQSTMYFTQIVIVIFFAPYTVHCTVCSIVNNSLFLLFMRF